MKTSTKKSLFLRIITAACLCLGAVLVFLVLPSILSGRNAGYRKREELTYMAYAGPVLPLTSLEADPDIKAERTVTFDFSPYHSRTETTQINENRQITHEVYDSESQITDAYTLYNHQKEAKTTTFLYPFIATLGSSAYVKPVITVGDTPVEPSLHIGPPSWAFEADIAATENETQGSFTITSWTGYQTLIEAGYQASAFDESPALNLPVIVYELKDKYGEESDAAPAPTLRMQFSIDTEKTKLLTYGFDSFSFDSETSVWSLGSDIPGPNYADYGTSAYLIVLGEDIGAYTLGAYTNGAFETVLDHAGATVLRYESTLAEIFAPLAEKYYDKWASVLFAKEELPLLSALSKDEWTLLAAELLSSSGIAPASFTADAHTVSLEEIFSLTKAANRIFYLAFSSTIPAESSILVQADMTKMASHDHQAGGPAPRQDGYDMLTKLGSTLSFTGQSASIAHTEAIEIVRQNFGFDIANGVNSVGLDPEVMHYYLEVKRKR